MLDEDIVQKVKFALSDWALEDLYKASFGGAKMGAFILASCYIDYLSCYYFNSDSSKGNYINFVNRFLPDYSGKDLYESLRCKLVHNYTEGGKYEFTDDKPHLHFKISKRRKIVINLENFLNDLKIAKGEYFKLVDDNKSYKERLIDRFKKVGILGRVEL